MEKDLLTWTRQYLIVSTLRLQDYGRARSRRGVKVAAAVGGVEVRGQARAGAGRETRS